MRLTTWNVNGIRNPFGYQPWNSARTFPAMFDILESDIVVMQELKIQRKDLRDDMVLIDGWDCYFSLPKQKKGYSGVGIFTRNATCAPIRAEEGVLGVLCHPNSTTAFRDLPESEHIGGYPTDLRIAEWGVDAALLDSEGRCVCLEFPAFVLFGVYSPANSNGLRDEFRHGFLCALECRIRNLIKMGKRVVLVGDLNVSRDEHDTAGAVEELRKNGMTHEEYVSTVNRRVFNQLLVGGEVIGERDEGREDPVLMDVVRDFHPDRKGMFTHWEQKVNARPGNFGSRIDFILASTAMEGWFSFANIQEGLMGSDHCPVYGDFKDTVTLQSDEGAQEVPLLDIMSPPGVFMNGARQKPWNIKEVPPFSAKLMPEFYQRRSIKDMFKKPTISRSTTSQTANAAATPPAATSDGLVPAAVCPADMSAAEITALSAATEDAMSRPSVTKTESPQMKRKTSETPASKPAKKAKVTTNGATKGAPPKGQQSLKGFFQAKGPAKKLDVDPPAPSKTEPSNISNGHADYLDGVHTGSGIATDNDILSTGSQLSSELRKSDEASHNITTALNSVCEGGETLTNKNSLTGASPLSPRSRQGNEILHNSTSAHRAIPEARSTQSPSKPIPLQSPSSMSVATTIEEGDDLVHDPIVSKESWQSLFRKKAAPLCEGHEEPCKSMLTKKKGENQGRSFWMCARPLGPSGQKEKNTQWRCGTFIWCSDWKGE